MNDYNPMNMPNNQEGMFSNPTNLFAPPQRTSMAAPSRSSMQAPTNSSMALPKRMQEAIDARKTQATNGWNSGGNYEAGDGGNNNGGGSPTSQKTNPFGDISLGDVAGLAAKLGYFGPVGYAYSFLDSLGLFGGSPPTMASHVAAANLADSDADGVSDNGMSLGEMGGVY
tara:strand:- start:162 stop:671 length:510 start_codon:yes stop_codon:yes gene_type:complete